MGFREDSVIYRSLTADAKTWFATQAVTDSGVTDCCLPAASIGEDGDWSRAAIGRSGLVDTAVVSRA